MTFRLQRTMATLIAAFLITGCGDTFRPTPIAIPKGSSPDPSGTRYAIVVSNNSGGTGAVTQIHVAGDTVSSVLQTGAGSRHVALNAVGGIAFVSNEVANTMTAYLPFGALSFQPVTITLPAGAAPRHAVLAGTNKGYVAFAGRNSVGVLDIGRNTLIGETAVGTLPVAVAASASGQKVYVVNQGSSNVTVISTVDDAVVATIPVGASPTWATSGGNYVYVANTGADTVSVIDTTTDTVVATLTTGGGPRHLAFDSRTLRVYVANAGGDSVSIIKGDATPPTVLGTVAVGDAPVSVAPLPDGSRVYVANSGCSGIVDLSGCTGNTVSVVDVVGFRELSKITVGTAPVSVAAATDSTRVYSANRDSDNISVIRTSNDTVLATFPAGAPKPVYVITTQN